MLLSNKKGVQHIVLALAKLGLKEVVICPGSRNAPLAISFNRHPYFHCTSIRDERSAAFFAFGKALELKQPVAIICTSGSASLNFAPAIVEAYYQRIPLIVITADREKEWTDQGDGQTMNQTGVYRNFIRKSYDLKGDAISETEIWYNQRCLSEGFNLATISDKGPVHFNIPMKEPLYGTEEITKISAKVFVEEVLEKQLSESAVAKLSDQFQSCKKVMILVGQQPLGKALQEVLSQVSSFENVIVLTESTSNIHHPNFVENIDRCVTNLNESESNNLMPGLLITVGGAIVSKRIKTLLRNHKPKFHWNIDPFDASMDTYQSLTSAIFMNAADLFRQLKISISNNTSGYRESWLQLKKQKEEAHQDFLKDCSFSDFNAFGKIYKAMADGITVHYSNSSSIRYAQLFDNTKIAETWCNRGTSGIDGCSSTAMGAAAASPEKDFLLITGDVAFHYDLNALWNDEAIQNLKIIILNNSGGGIFRIIEGPNKVEERSRFLETKMQSSALKVAEHFKWNYLSATEVAGLENALDSFFNKGTKRTILEIFTNAEKNPEVLKDYWEFLNDCNE